MFHVYLMIYYLLYIATSAVRCSLLLTAQNVQLEEYKLRNLRLLLRFLAGLKIR